MTNIATAMVRFMVVSDARVEEAARQVRPDQPTTAVLLFSKGVAARTKGRLSFIWWWARLSPADREIVSAMCIEMGKRMELADTLAPADALALYAILRWPEVREVFTFYNA